MGNQTSRERLMLDMTLHCCTDVRHDKALHCLPEIYLRSKKYSSFFKLSIIPIVPIGTTLSLD